MGPDLDGYLLAFGEARDRVNDFDNLGRRAKRIGCEILTREALDALLRGQRAHERLQDDYADLIREKRELAREVATLRREVSVLHWRAKTRLGRARSRWHRLGRLVRSVGGAPRADRPELPRDV